MRCPVHNLEGCECAYAVRWREAMLKSGEAPGLVCGPKLGPIQPRTAPLLLALSFAGAVIACGPRPATCSERDAQLITNETLCLAQVKTKCAGIPLDEPCPFEDKCNAFTRERCQ